MNRRERPGTGNPHSCLNYVSRVRTFAVLGATLLWTTLSGCSNRKTTQAVAPQDSDPQLVVSVAINPQTGSRPLPPDFAALKNSDLFWDGDIVGWYPTMHENLERSSRRVLAAGSRSIPELKHLLADPERYIVAHVLLTQLAGNPFSSFPTYNHLPLVPLSGGRWSDERAVVCKFWEADCGDLSSPEADNRPDAAQPRVAADGAAARR